MCPPPLVPALTPSTAVKTVPLREQGPGCPPPPLLSASQEPCTPLCDASLTVEEWASQLQCGGGGRFQQPGPPPTLTQDRASWIITSLAVAALHDPAI